MTGVLTLSGTNKLIVTLSGNANSHTSGDNINNLAIEFFTGAFVNINPSDVIDSSKT
ncbi:hypothetical protein KKG31_03805 [Patescibacteria group bacterium]|nr:hypothetical protein [Patescibacteria group bacterium]MBU1758268.1 hypothetical protein [Patescibacteria group bacterium]